MDFTAFVIMALLAVGMPGGMIMAQTILGPKVRSPLKEEPFESGQKTFGIAKGGIPIKFYQIAMLFIIFDLEIVFLWPWAVALRDLVRSVGLVALLPMGVFLGLLAPSFVFAWRKGVLKWES